MTTKTAKTTARSCSVQMHLVKECKGSRRFDANDGDAPIQSIYINRSISDGMGDTVTVTVS